MTKDPNQGRLARALGSFWYSGAGPTRRELDMALDHAGIPATEESDALSKRLRVEDAVAAVDGKAELRRVMTFLLGLLAEGGELEPSQHSPGNARDLERLNVALRPYGWGFSRDGRLTGDSTPTVESSHAERVAVIREHVDRLNAMAERGDAAGAIGSSKDLIESAVRLVHDELDIPYAKRTNFPRLAADAEKALGLHASLFSGEDELAVLVKKMLGNLSTLALTVNDFRKEAGSGHGRSTVIHSMTRRHAKMIAGSAIVYTEMLLDTLEDPAAPWRREEGASNVG